MRSFFIELRTSLYCIFSLIVISHPVLAQGLNVNFDYATFRYDSARTYAEFYYSFNTSTLHFTRTVNHDTARALSFTDSLLFDVSIRKVDSIAARQAWKTPEAITDTTQEYIRKNLVGKIDFLLFPGNYSLVVRCVDMNNSLNADSLISAIPIPSYNSDKLEMSGIELCSTITKGNGSGIFYKNTYDVIPNPTAIYGLGMPIIYYYLEVYNIPPGAGDSSFTAGYEIRDSYGQVRKSSYRAREKFGNSSVEVGTINGSNLKTGAYTFTYTVVDSAVNLYAVSSRKFFIYNPNLGKPESPDTTITGSAILSSVYTTMGKDQLDKEFAEARYISSTEERNRYEKLTTVDSKRQFLYDFWNKRKSDEVSKSGDARSQYLERIAYANDHFRAGMRDGWKTDRGRVYVLYGNPDEIDRHPNETDSKPYEIWTYNSLEGGVSFDFVDRTGFGDYSLVNSTEHKEIHDDNWQQYLTQ